LLLLVPSLLWGRMALSGYELAIMLLLALVQFTFPYFLFSWALQRVQAQRAALLLLLEVVLNPIWTLLAVQEVPPRATLLGGPLILLGVGGAILVGWRRRG
jgi:drug/metabolite transporter (DMT)-like permease